MVRWLPSPPGHNPVQASPEHPTHELAGKLRADLCVFDENVADERGGAIYAERADIRFERCTFTNNRAISDGGAICFSYSLPHSLRYGLQIRDGIFMNNGAELGGAIMVDSSARALIRSSKLMKNNAGNVSPGCPSATSISPRVSYLRPSTPLQEGGGKPCGVDVCRVRGLRAQRGGGIYVRRGLEGATTTTLTVQTTLLRDNLAPLGKNLYLGTGTTTAYVLPAPPGHWVPATRCEIWREADAEALCATNYTENVNPCQDVSSSSACPLATESQPCNWRNDPSLLGEVVYALPLSPHDSHDEALPAPCSIGLLGGNGSDPGEQTSATCAGLCPAGSFCADEATVQPIVCPKGHFCPEGASMPMPCAEGTYSDEIGLSRAAQCTQTDPGFYAIAGSTRQTECAVGTAQPDAGKGSCNKCEAGTFQDNEGQSSCRICSVGSFSANILSCEKCQVGEYCPEGSKTGSLCPIGSTTAGRGAQSFGECGCRAGTYDAALGDEITCKQCNADMLCESTGVTLASVPLRTSSWRHSNRTAAVYKCGTSACLGGEWNGTSDGYCAPGHEGPLCQWCSDPNLYYDTFTATCKDCGQVAAYAVKQTILILVVVAALAAVRVGIRRAPSLLSRVARRLAQLATAAQQFGLQAK